MNPIQIVFYAAAAVSGLVGLWLFITALKTRSEPESRWALKLGGALLLGVVAAFCANAATALTGEDEATVRAAGGEADLVADDDDFFEAEFDDFGDPPAEGDEDPAAE
jgi:hypothetical protein